MKLRKDKHPARAKGVGVLEVAAKNLMPGMATVNKAYYTPTQGKDPVQYWEISRRITDVEHCMDGSIRMTVFDLEKPNKSKTWIVGPDEMIYVTW